MHRTSKTCQKASKRSRIGSCNWKNNSLWRSSLYFKNDAYKLIWQNHVNTKERSKIVITLMKLGWWKISQPRKTLGNITLLEKRLDKVAILVSIDARNRPLKKPMLWKCWKKQILTFSPIFVKVFLYYQNWITRELWSPSSCL